MEPVGLTFKKAVPDKFGKPKRGEIMAVHRCQKCGRISLNRLAADDEVKVIWDLFEKSLNFSAEIEGIEFLGKEDKEEVKRQLFGKT